MAFEHINRITGRNGAGDLVVAPLIGTKVFPNFEPKNSNVGKLATAPVGFLYKSVIHPHRFLALQALIFGLTIAEYTVPDTSTSSVIVAIGLILGLWAIYYIPLIRIVAKLTTSLVYAVLAYRISLFGFPSISVTEQTFSIKHLASEVPIASSIWLYLFCGLVVLITLYMQTARPED